MPYKKNYNCKAIHYRNTSSINKYYNTVIMKPITKLII